MPTGLIRAVTCSNVGNPEGHQRIEAKVCSRAKTAVRDKLRKLKEKLSAEPAHGAGSQPSPGCHTQ